MRRVLHKLIIDICKTIHNSLCVISTILNHITQQLSWVKPSFYTCIRCFFFFLMSVLDVEVVSYTIYIINNSTLTNDIIYELHYWWLTNCHDSTLIMFLKKKKKTLIINELPHSYWEANHCGVSLSKIGGIINRFKIQDSTDYAFYFSIFFSYIKNVSCMVRVWFLVSFVNCMTREMTLFFLFCFLHLCHTLSVWYWHKK